MYCLVSYDICKLPTELRAVVIKLNCETNYGVSGSKLLVILLWTWGVPIFHSHKTVVITDPRMMYPTVTEV